jgi:hypothetical protein
VLFLLGGGVGGLQADATEAAGQRNSKKAAVLNMVNVFVEKF